MNDREGQFCERVGAVLRRFVYQNAGAMPAEEVLRETGARLWALVRERGLPPPLADGDPGVPGGMTEEECAPLVAGVMAGGNDPVLVNAVKQLVKTCFYPEFRVCRDSYRTVAADGGCRRQERERVRGRVSGTHCVDCPHWIGLEPGEHERFLAEAWRTNPVELARDRDLFLPEDFRALRRWLRSVARAATR